MDLGAYARIDELEEVMDRNNIVVPRLRGLRLMSEEKPITEEEIKEMINNYWLDECADLCCRDFNINATWTEWSSRTLRTSKKYMKFEKNEDGSPRFTAPIGVKWHKVHGKKRKAFKYAKRKIEKRVRAQYNMWNKYAGQENILYIHARLGSANWPYYNCDHIIKGQDWYLDHIEDSFDCTYVDIFAKVEV